MVDLGSDPKLVNKSLNVKKGNDNKKNLYAALDLGTNSCRMLIARPTGSRFEIVDAFSKSIRLGIDLERTGQLSQAGITRALQALNVCAKKLNKFAKKPLFLKSFGTDRTSCLFIPLTESWPNSQTFFSLSFSPSK